MRGLVRFLPLAAMAGALALTSAASAQTRFERPEACRIKITIPIEIFTQPHGSRPNYSDGSAPDYADAGEAASPELARDMARRIEATWNGPTAEEAQALAGSMGLDQVNDDSSRDLSANSDRIREEWARYAREFNVDRNCAWVPCCPIEIDADVRYRAFDAAPTPGYHQIGIMGPEHRSFVLKVRNPDLPDDVETDWSNPDHYVRGDRAQTDGIWANRGDGRRSPDAHEVGHLMGLPDQYSDAGGTNAGHHHDVMASNHGFPFADALEALRVRSGFDCEDCCPARDELTAIMTDYNLVIGDAGDMIATCDREAILRQIVRLQNLRRRLNLSNADARQKAINAALIDAQIARLEAALRDCPRNDRFVTGSDPGPAISTGGDFTPIPVDNSSDSTEWCTYREGTVTGGTLVPGTPGDDPGDVIPPTGPGITPEDGDDPRDAPGTPPGTTPDDGGDDPRDAPGTPPGSTPDGGGGDDPRDTPRPGLPGLPGGGSTPDEDDDDDPSDTPTEEDGDDPRDVPVTIHVKARASVMEGGNQASEVGGQTIRLLTPETTNPPLPLEGNQRDDREYDGDPLQCQTDEEGDCQIMVDTGTMFGLGMNAFGNMGFQLASDYTMEVETPDRESQIISTSSPLSQEDIAGLTGAAVTGDEITVTELNLSSGLSYRLDYGLKAGYAWDDYIDTNIEYVEDNVCRDKQPGPPLGWTPPHLENRMSRPGEDLPRQTLVLPGLSVETEVRP